MKTPKIVVKYALGELFLIAAAGYCVGRYVERNKYEYVVNEDNKVEKLKKNAKRIHFNDGKLTIDIF